MTCSWPKNTKLDQNPKCIFYSMGCPHNLVNGRGLKVNTAKHSSEKGEDGSHPPFLTTVLSSVNF